VAAAGTGKIVINPGSPTWGYLTRDEIEALGRGRLPLGLADVVTEPTELQIAIPQIPPSPPALDALGRRCSPNPRPSRPGTS